jgi:hypothetical protein
VLNARPEAKRKQLQGTIRKTYDLLHHRLYTVIIKRRSKRVKKGKIPTANMRSSSRHQNLKRGGRRCFGIISTIMEWRKDQLATGFVSLPLWEANYECGSTPDNHEGIRASPMRNYVRQKSSSRAKLTVCGQVLVPNIWVVVLQVSTLPMGNDFRAAMPDAWMHLYKQKLIHDHRSSKCTQTNNWMSGEPNVA